MKKEIIKEIIKDFHEMDLPGSKARSVKIPIDSSKIVTISGVRRSGKTFVIFETIKSLLSNKISKTKIIYINFEDERLELNQKDLDLILQSYRELYPDLSLSECYFFFDEVQNLNGWEKFIRRIYDTVTKNIFITGSNSKLLSKEIATSLRGRAITYEIFPLSFSEYLCFKDVKTDLYHSQNKAKIINLFDRFIFEGGFPEIATCSDSTIKNKILQEYFDVMLYRDIIERFNITNISALKYFLKRVFENVTSPLSVNNIYNELKSQGYKIGKNFLYEYLDISESIYLFLIAKKYSESTLKQELSGKKVYAIDNGLLNAATFKFSKDHGKLLENIIFLELYKNSSKVFFYKNKRECDFIVFEKSQIMDIIQVSYSLEDKNTREREIEGLAETCKRFGVRDGHIITFSEEEHIKIEGISINIIPAYKFLLANLQRK